MSVIMGKLDACPNVNSREWKELVSHLNSEKEAYRAFISNDFRVPSVNKFEKDFKNETEFKRYSERVIFNQKQLQDSYEKLSVLENKLDDTRISKEEKKKLFKKKTKINREINRLSSEIYRLINEENLDELDELFQRDLRQVKEILEMDEISPQDIMVALKIIDYWKTMGNHPHDNGFFSEEEIENIKNKEAGEQIEKALGKFAVNKQQMEGIEDEVNSVVSDLMKQEAFRVFGDNLTDELRKIIEEADLSSVVKELNPAFANFINISEIDHVMYQTMHALFKEAETKYLEEFGAEVNNIEQIFGKLSKEQVNLMKQRVSNSDQRNIGNITLRFTEKYMSRVTNAHQDLEKEIERIEKQDISEQEKTKQINKKVKEKLKFLKNNQILVNPNKLFTPPDNEFIGEGNKAPTKEDIEKHKKELEKHLGSREVVDMYVKQMEEMVNNYKEKMELLEEDLRENEGIEDERAIQNELEEYRDLYSPFRHAESYISEIKLSDNQSKLGFDQENLIGVALRYDENGKPTDYYDKNFDKIQKDENLREAYWYTINLLKKLHGIAPKHIMQGFDINTLPDVQKTFAELFSKEGLQRGMKKVHDSIVEFSTTSQTEKDVDPLEKKIQVNGIKNNSIDLANYLNLKRIQYIRKHGEDPSAEYMNKLRIEKQVDLAKDKTEDISKVLKAYASSMLMYKHKAAIQDSLSAMYNITNNIIQEATERKQKQGSESQKGRFKSTDQMKSMLDFAISKFYGYNVKEKTSNKSGELPFTTKTQVSPSNKKAYDEIIDEVEELTKAYKNGEIKEDLYHKQYEELMTAKTALEHERSIATMADALNQYIRLKGIGWNVFSGVANVGFGLVSNWLRASDGRIYSNKELRKGYKLVMNSMFKSLTFGAYENKTAKKIRALMDKYDFLKKSKHEIIDRKNAESKNKWGFISPWNLMERGEYMNQAPVMVAMMLKQKVMLNGETISLWEAFNEDGSIKEGVKMPSENFIAEFKGNFDRTIARDHGNYDPTAALKADKHFFTRLLKTFRTWLAQGVYTRFGNNRPSFATGTIEKGRWSTWATMFSNENGPKDMNNVLQKASFISKQFLNKLWGKTSFDYFVHKETGNKIKLEQYEQLNEEGKANYQRGLSEVDAANMRANLTEIYMLLSTIAFGLMLKALIKSGEDDDDMDRSLRFTLNLVGRIQTDLMMYISPVEFDRIMRDPIPLTSIIVDTTNLLSHSSGLLMGQGDDIIKYGSYHGQSRSWRYISEIIPGMNVIKRIDSLGRSQYKK